MGSPLTEDQILAEARVEIGYADAKAAILFAAFGVGFGAFLGGVIASDWQPGQLTPIVSVFWWLGALSLLLATASTGSALWPRIGACSATGRVTYWGDVAASRSQADMERRLEEHPTTGQERTREQIWALSKIVARKHTLVRFAMAWAAASAGCFVVVGIYLAVA